MALPALGLVPMAASFLIGMFGGSLFSPPIRSLGYMTNRMWPNQILPVADLMNLAYRHPEMNDYVDDELKAWGFGSDKRQQLFHVTEQLMNASELVHLYWRSPDMSKGELYEQTARLGWKTDSIDNLVNVLEFIPSASDIIAFAVREVYSPEIAESFGQFEGASDVIDKASDDIRASGMSPETFRKYWAAHWQLPSIQQGFEMVHRRAIPISGEGSELDMNKLMVALDVMPAWREKLLQISYSPYTRVDVRRMHKMGILSDDDLVSSYMDLGYDQDHAKGMAMFTILYNAEPEAAEQTEADKDKAKEKDLTKSDILTGYRDGLLVKAETELALSNLGYDQLEVKYYIDRVEYNRDKDDTDSYLKYYHDAYIRNIMDYNKVVSELGKLNLPATRTERLFAIWDVEKASKTLKPTKAELLTFFRKGIIDKDVLISELVGLGYPDRYINWYVRSA